MGLSNTLDGVSKALSKSFAVYIVILRLGDVSAGRGRRRQRRPSRSSLAIEPAVDLGLRLVLGVTVVLLEAAFELVTLAVDDVQVIVGELAPLFLGLASELFPVSFDTIPIHGSIP